MRPWREPTPTAISPDLLAVMDGSAIAAAALVRRGISEAASARRFIDPAHYTPADPFDLPDMAAAVARLRRALAEDEPIAIWGDFDVDGQTATALLSEALTAHGARIVRHIPDRATDGHGVQIPALTRLIDQGARLIVTCDTGIAAHEAIAYAKSRGVEVIVTDHHHLADSLPPALANINPQRLAPDHPMFTLPGVGVALQLVRALDPDPARSDPLLDLVALGIVADVAVQTGDTRFWLQRGLRRLRENARPGLDALYQSAGLEAARIDEGHIGFTIAPRLNAAGRLAQAMLGVDLLLERDPELARTIALTLESLNTQRRALVDQITAQAEARLSADSATRTADVILLADPQWHPGVLGIVANRLVDRFNVPVILLETSSPDGEARGSARSVDGVNITEALAAHADLLLSYGGHTMAAGLRLMTRQIDALRRALSKTVRARRGPIQPGELVIDAAARVGDLTVASAEAVARLAPFGAGNPPVVLALYDLTVTHIQTMGRAADHRALTLTDPDGHTVRALWWDGASQPVPEANAAGRIDLACTVRASTYKGAHRVEVVFVDARPAQPRAASTSSRTFSLLDMRDHLGKPAALEALRSMDSALQVWREGGDPTVGAARHQLQPCRTLVIWTTPPDRASLVAALETAKPETIALFAVDPVATHGDAFHKRLLALLKYALDHKAGQVAPTALAAALGVTLPTVSVALAWAEALGAIRVTARPDTPSGHWQIAAGTSTSNADRLSRAARDLEHLLDEMTAFRRFIRRADLDGLFGQMR